MNSEAQPLVEHIRGGYLESQHRGVIAVCDSTGHVLYSLGEPSPAVFLRSSAKPIQAIPVIESGAADRFALDPPELAVICGSHNGEEYHVEAVGSILRKAGLSQAALQCPAPSGKAPIHNNCSGKHAGMLATCVHMGWPTEDYRRLDHPVQRQIRRVWAEFAGLAPYQLGWAIDGCGVPTWAAPIQGIALAFARLADPSSFAGKRQEACVRVVQAMQAHPEMVAGTAPRRICTDLMRAKGRALVAKSGAGCLYAVGVLPGHCPGYSGAVGIALKIEDGDGRGFHPAVIEALRQLGILQRDDLEALRPYWDVPIKDGLDHIVGQIRPCFTLAREERPQSAYGGGDAERGAGAEGVAAAGCAGALGSEPGPLG